MVAIPAAPSPRRAALALVASICAGILGGCGDAAPPPRAPLARVKVATAEPIPFAPMVTLTGTIKAQVESDLSFRVGGKIIERNVDVGDHVAADQVLARLYPQQQEAGLESAKAGVESARAQLKQADANFARQKELLTSGFTTRRDYDLAEQGQRSAQALLDSANAQLSAAQDQLAYTVLRAGVAGIITARYAETGQVVAQAKAIFTIATEGGRDAIFDLDEAIFARAQPGGPVVVALEADPSVTTTGTVREVSPSVDVNGTVRIKVGLTDVPPAMTLGAVVAGSGRLKERRVVVLPSSALFELWGEPAVWVVDPRSRTVSLKPIAVDQYTAAGIVDPGEMVVTAGVQSLRPGQQVAIAGGES